MARTTDIVFTLGYTDDTTKDVTVGPFRPTEVNSATIKENVISYNNAFTSDTALLSVSKYGSPYTGITRARIVTSEQIMIFG